jgi:FKBP-type peptidyl-prolyl cis-trans isomerase 2
MKDKKNRIMIQILILVISIALILTIQSSQAYTTNGGITENDRVDIRYRGYFPNGTVFDNGGEVVFTVKTGSGGVIQGFYDILIGMKVGDEKIGAAVPPETGYSTGPLAGETLLFDVKILELVYDAYPDDGDQSTETGTITETTTETTTETITETITEASSCGSLPLNFTPIVISLGLTLLLRKKK